MPTAPKPFISHHLYSWPFLAYHSIIAKREQNSQNNNQVRTKPRLERSSYSHAFFFLILCVFPCYLNLFCIRKCTSNSYIWLNMYPFFSLIFLSSGWFNLTKETLFVVGHVMQRTVQFILCCFQGFCASYDMYMQI